MTLNMFWFEVARLINIDSFLQKDFFSFFTGSSSISWNYIYLFWKCYFMNNFLYLNIVFIFIVY